MSSGITSVIIPDIESAAALEEYCMGRRTSSELRGILGYGTRAELDGFLKEHGVNGSMTGEEFDRQMQDLDRKAAADDIVARFQAFAAGHTLGDLDMKDLISEGRRYSR